MSRVFCGARHAVSMHCVFPCASRNYYGVEATPSYM